MKRKEEIHLINITHRLFSWWNLSCYKHHAHNRKFLVNRVNTKSADAMGLCIARSLAAMVLTHWGRVTHLCLHNLTITGPDNGLSPGRRQAIIYLNQCWNIVNWTLRNKLQWNFNRNSYIFIQGNALKMSSWKWGPFCLGLNVLTVRENTRCVQPGTISTSCTIPKLSNDRKCEWISNASSKQFSM